MGQAKTLNGYKVQYQTLDKAINTAQFIRNKEFSLWRYHSKVNKARLSVPSKELTPQFPFAKKLNSMACQALAQRAWNLSPAFIFVVERESKSILV